MQGLPSFVGQGRGLRGFRVKRKYCAVRRIDAAPGLSILILLVTNGDAEFLMSEAAANEVDQHAGIGAPIGIEQFPSLEQIPRKIEGCPRRAVGRRIVILEELSEEGAIGGGVLNLMTPYPIPQRASRNGKLLVSMREQRII